MNISEINDRYSLLEQQVYKKLENVRKEEEKLQKFQERNPNQKAKSTSKLLSYEEAVMRNANLLKLLEMTKARLRSRSTYSPVEQILQRAIENYKHTLETCHRKKN